MGQYEGDPLWAQSRIPLCCKRPEGPFRRVDEQPYSSQLSINCFSHRAEGRQGELQLPIFKSPKKAGASKMRCKRGQVRSARANTNSIQGQEKVKDTNSKSGGKGKEAPEWIVIRLSWWSSVPGKRMKRHSSSGSSALYSRGKSLTTSSWKAQRQGYGPRLPRSQALITSVVQ